MSRELALEKIAAEKKAKTGELNLSYQDLREIPKKILELNHLQYSMVR